MENDSKILGKIKLVVIILVCILAALVIAGIMYVRDYYPAEDMVLAAMASDSGTTVEQINDKTMVFLPAEGDPVAGLIFYPGGKVEYTAYAPLLHALAQQGVLCVLVEMPFNLAVLDVDAAEGIQEKFPEIQDWYIGGHSLGGSMAASYVAEHQKEYRGLVLLAAYSTEDLSGSGLKVVSIYGSKDEVMNMKKYQDNRSNLPGDTREYVIEGGCHAQFGCYGVQEGDGIPALSGEEQRSSTVRFIVDSIK